MTATVTIHYANLPGTQAGAGRTGSRVVIADRPAGKAGGQGLGMNGGELFAAALGGCFWNDLHYAAERLGHRLASAEVDCEIDLAGHPLRVVRARVTARLVADPAGAARDIFDSAAADSTIANSVRTAVPVAFELKG